MGIITTILKYTAALSIGAVVGYNSHQFIRETIGPYVHPATGINFSNRIVEETEGVNGVQVAYLNDRRIPIVQNNVGDIGHRVREVLNDPLLEHKDESLINYCVHELATDEDKREGHDLSLAKMGARIISEFPEEYKHDALDIAQATITEFPNDVFDTLSERVKHHYFKRMVNGYVGKYMPRFGENDE